MLAQRQTRARNASLERVADELSLGHWQVINDGGWANGVVLEAQRREDRLVVKTYRTRRWPIRLIGRYLLSRERRAYQALEGVAGVPRLRRSDDPESLILEQIDGVKIDRCVPGAEADRVVQSLRELVQTMHQRGVYHMDLRNRGNILVNPGGRAVVLDFASAVIVQRGGWLSRLLAAACRRFDFYGLSKWETLARVGRG